MSRSRSLFPTLLLAWGAMAVGVHGCAAQRPASPTDDQAGQVVSVEHETRVHGTAPDHTATADPAAAPAAAPIVETPAAPVAPPSFVEENKLRVLDVRAATGDTGSRWVIELSRTPDKIHSFELSSPRRCVIDVAGPSATSHGQQTLDTGDRMIPRLRVGGYTDHLRLVLEPAPEVSSPCIAETDGTAVVVALGDPPSGAEPHQVWSALSIPDGAAAHATFVLAKAAPGSATPAADPPVPAVADAKTGASADPTTTASAGDLTVSSPATPAAPEAPTAATKADPAPAEKDHLPPGSQPPLAAPAAPEDSHAVTPVSMSGADARATAAEQHLQPHYTGRRISLEFKDADIQNVLRIIADVAQKNIVATEDVKGRVTIVLRDLPWDQALDILLKSTGLEKVDENDVITVSTSKRLEEERKSRLAAFQAGQQLEPLQTAYLRVNYVKASDLEKIIRGPLLNGAGQAQGQASLNPDQLLGLLSRRGNVQTNEATNTLIVRDVADGIRNARELVRRLDVQTPEVLIESSIFEANTNFDRDLGVQWGAKYIASPETGNPTGRNFPGRVAVGGAGPLTGGASSGSTGSTGTGTTGTGTTTGTTASGLPILFDFPASGVVPGAGSTLGLVLGSLSGSASLDAQLTALEQAGRGKVVSRPKVITLNNTEAIIQSLEILRVRLPSTGTVINTGAGGAAGGQTTATEKIETGITLRVTPQVSSDGFVLLQIFVKSSVPSNQTTDQIPNEISREATSRVLIHEGETVVIGGVFRQLTNNAESGVPFLRSVPILGWAFKNSTRQDDRTELVVFITPRVLKGSLNSDAAVPTAAELWEKRDHSVMGTTPVGSVEGEQTRELPKG